MKIKILFTLSALIALWVSACKSTPDLTEEEVYTLLNEIIADDSLPISRVCQKFEDIELTAEIKSEFTEQDLQFISQQKTRFKNKTIKSGKLKWFHKRKKVFINTNIEPACDRGSLYRISFPLVSADRHKILIELNEDCNCMLGGTGGKYLYEKKNGRWVRTRAFDRWIGEFKNKPENKS